RQAQIFGLPSGQGLSTVLSGRTEQQTTFPVAGLSRLSVLPAGPLPPNPQELLSRNAFAALVKDLQSVYDVVVLDARALPQPRWRRWSPAVAALGAFALLYAPAYWSLAQGLWRDDEYAHGP